MYLRLLLRQAVPVSYTHLSEWLIGVVENLLYVTRLNDGRLKLELTDQLVDEVVNEAVSHLKKKSVGHKVTVRCDDLILARMDAQLIVQVIVNLIDNALKYTEQGSEICVSAEKMCIRDSRFLTK